METLLQEMLAFVERYPSATVTDLRAGFGEPVHQRAWYGSYKDYHDLVFQRGGQFVHVQHREFATYQVIRVREVEPMEIVTVKIQYVPSRPGSEDDPDGWVNQSRFAPTAEAVMEALCP